MGFIFKQKYTQSLPSDAKLRTKSRKPTKRELKADPSRLEIVETIARWRDRSGDWCEGVLVGTNRVRMESATWTARYRDGDKLIQTVPTGCRDKSAAETMLKELEKTAERIQVGILTTSELSTASVSQSNIEPHIEKYIDFLKHSSGKGKRQRVSAKHLVNVKRSVDRIVTDCGFKTLREINRDEVQRWVSDRLEDTAAAWSNRTINSHVEALKAFCAWCVDKSKPKRLMNNPLAKFPMLDTESSLKRPRRALTGDELNRLLMVARLRPVAEFGRETVRKVVDEQPNNNRSRATWMKAALKFDTIQAAYERGRVALQDKPEKLLELERLGIERELLYLILVTTGLRKGELSSLTIGQVYLDESPAWIELSYRDEKAGRGACVPLRDDVADRLRIYLADRNDALESDSEASGVVPISAKSSRQKLDEPLIPVPTQLVRILDRDLAAAGIAKLNERGESVDVHAMRHTFSTMLHRAGVSPSVAQAAMRHSDIRLTMKTYNHLGLIDVAGAVEMLPGMSGNLFLSETVSATGTDDNESSLTSTLTSAGAKPSVRESFTVEKPAVTAISAKDSKIEKNPCFSRKNKGFW